MNAQTIENIYDTYTAARLALHKAIETQEKDRTDANCVAKWKAKDAFYSACNAYHGAAQNMPASLKAISTPNPSTT